MNLAPYLKSRYLAGGRGPDTFDCWGMARHARAALFGRPLLDDCLSAAPGDLRAITRECDRVVSLAGLTEVAARPGAFATAWPGRCCEHIGLVVRVDNRLWVLETDDAPGFPAITPVSTFKSRYARVIFYDDQNLP